jgi:hypothetical protein
MAKGMVLIGRGDGPAPSASIAEHAAQEYFVNRRLAGNYARRPPVERWRADLRERFERELERLEREAYEISRGAIWSMAGFEESTISRESTSPGLFSLFPPGDLE